MPRRPRDDDRGQATVEFALVAPLLVGCALVVLVVLRFSLDVLALDDVARRCARLSAVTGSSTHPGCADASVITDSDTGLVTVTVSRPWTLPLPLVDQWLPALSVSSSATTVLEPPLVIG